MRRPSKRAEEAQIKVAAKEAAAKEKAEVAQAKAAAKDEAAQAKAAAKDEAARQKAEAAQAEAAAKEKAEVAQAAAAAKEVPTPAAVPPLVSMPATVQNQPEITPPIPVGQPSPEQESPPVISAPSSLPQTQVATPAVVEAETAKSPKRRRSPKITSLRKIAKKEGKGIQRSIRPIRSRTQRTTSRLIWAVFGMALIIVSIVGFWIVLSDANDTEPATLEVYVTNRDIEEGELLSLDALTILELEVEGINHVPISQAQDIVNRRVLSPIPSETPLTLGVLGEVPQSDVAAADYEITLSLGSDRTTVSSNLFMGDRVVLLAIPNEMPEIKFAVEVVEIFALSGGGDESGGSGIVLKVTFDERAWWESLIQRYIDLEGISWEFERIADDNNELCWRERYRFTYQIEALSTEDYRSLLAELDCPVEWVEEALTYQSPGSFLPDLGGIFDTESIEGEGFSVADRLLADRFAPEDASPPPLLEELLRTEEETADGGASAGGGAPAGGLPFPPPPQFPS